MLSVKASPIDKSGKYPVLRLIKAAQSQAVNKSKFVAMGRRNRREIKTFEGVQILSAGSEGKAIAKIDGKVVFVPYAAPGDIATLQV
ncbi:MAG: TRAM domain-containing protein, partial [Luteibaculum sp.]